MLGAMGLERKLRRSAIAVAVLFVASGDVAAAREPLIVTELADANLVPLAGSERSSEQSLDDATRRFSLAVAQAIQSEQRSIEQACRSRTTPDGTVRFDWHASCLYRRH